VCLTKKQKRATAFENAAANSRERARARGQTLHPDAYDLPPPEIKLWLPWLEIRRQMRRAMTVVPLAARVPKTAVESTSRQVLWACE
jgi:hypothetical protein